MPVLGGINCEQLVFYAFQGYISEVHGPLWETLKSLRWKIYLRVKHERTACNYYLILLVKGQNSAKRFRQKGKKKRYNKFQKIRKQKRLSIWQSEVIHITWSQHDSVKNSIFVFLALCLCCYSTAATCFAFFPSVAVLTNCALRLITISLREPNFYQKS